MVYFLVNRGINVLFFSLLEVRLNTNKCISYSHNHFPLSFIHSPILFGFSPLSLHWAGSLRLDVDGRHEINQSRSVRLSTLDDGRTSW